MSIGSAPSPTSVASMLDAPVCDALIDLYFNIIHNKQQILFQRQQFLLDRQTGRVPTFILLGMCALVARFSTNPYFKDQNPQDRGKPIVREALQHYNTREHAITVQSLQAAMLLEHACAVEGFLDEASLLAAQAVRMGQIIRLQDTPSHDRIQRETAIRLYWSVFMMDVWTSSRDQLPRQLSARDALVGPMDEATFESLKPGVTQIHAVIDMEASRQASVFHHVYILHETYAEILDLIRRIVKHPAHQFEVDRSVQDLSDRLDHWLETLPPSLQNTPENLQAFQAQGRGREFSVLYLIYHHQCQLLYFAYLHKYSPGISTRSDNAQAARFAGRCKAHAEALSELMWSINTTSGLECLWSPTNGHLLVVASSVHLHSLLLDHDPLREPRLRRLLEQNFVMLLQFQTYWSTLGAPLSRLKALHQTCSCGDYAASFKMDDWMLRYLTEFGEPIENRRSPNDSGETQPDRASADQNWKEFYDPESDVHHALRSSLSFWDDEGRGFAHLTQDAWYRD